MLRIPPNLLKDVRSVARALARHGWAEAGAGNFSVRLGSRLLVKRAGARMRDVAEDPRPGLCLVSTSPPHEVLPRSARPTSELPTHLACQETLLALRPAHQAVLHTHPTHLCALSLCARRPPDLLRLLLSAHAESALVQGRVSVLAEIAPGSQRLAHATAQALRRHDTVVWPRHGAVATGPDLPSCLDLIEILDKLAELVLLSRL